MTEDAIPDVTPVVTSDQGSPLQIEALQAKLAEASAKADWKAVTKLARELTEATNAKAKAEREALQAAIAGLTEKVKAIIDKAVAKMIEAGELDGADGVWYSKDFGDESSGCRLLKSAPKAKGEATGGNGGSYVSRPEKSSDLLKEHGATVLFAAETKRTIDKVEHTFPAGYTIQEAWDYNTNGGWRNFVRQQLLKAAGLI